MGKVTDKNIYYRSPDFYEKNGVETLFGTRVTKIDTAAKNVVLSDGNTVPYDKLMVATGSKPFVPPMNGLDKIASCHTFMSYDSVKAIRAEVKPGMKVLIIGAGLIGLKAAEALNEYKADIKSKLEKAAADEASMNLDNALVDAVISKMTAEVPQVLYQRRIDDIVREWSARNRIRVEDYLKYTGATMDQFRANFTEVAKRQVDLRLALEKIAELENIAVSDEDLEKEYADMAEQYKMDVEKIKTIVAESALSGDLRISNALEFIKKNAKVKKASKKKAEETEETAE